jgi:hypothetical protein
MLIRLIYASAAAADMDHPTLDRVLAQARRNNTQRDITGLLAFDSAHFLQVLEGGRDTISALYTRICGDDRHRNVTLLQCGDIEERAFDRWTMGFAAADASHRALFMRHASRARFDPRVLTGASALALLMGLRDIAGKAPSTQVEQQENSATTR